MKRRESGNRNLVTHEWFYIANMACQAKMGDSSIKAKIEHSVH